MAFGGKKSSPHVPSTPPARGPSWARAGCWWWAAGLHGRPACWPQCLIRWELKLWGVLVGKPMGKPNEYVRIWEKLWDFGWGLNFHVYVRIWEKLWDFCWGLNFHVLCENMGKPMGKPRKKLLWTVQVKQSHKVEKHASGDEEKLALVREVESTWFVFMQIDAKRRFNRGTPSHQTDDRRHGDLCEQLSL